MCSAAQVTGEGWQNRWRNAKIRYVPEERSFLTVYDYGMGGVWTYIIAASSDQIRQAYPQLQIVMEPPQWMEDHPRQIRTLHLDDRNDVFLAALRAEHNN